MTDNRSGAGSFIYRMHPAVKLFIFICLIQAASSSANTLSFLFFSTLSAGLAFHLKISPDQILSKLKPFLFLLVFTFIINIFFGGGAELSAMLTFRFLLIILFSLLLTFSTETRELVTVMLYPFKGRHGENLRVVFMVAMEFIPLFVKEVKTISADIRKMPQYRNKPYKALFKPDLYIAPVTQKMIEMSEQAAKDVEQGNYGAVTLSQPALWEYGAAFCFFVMAVKYAL